MIKTLGVVHIGLSDIETPRRCRMAERRLAGVPLVDWVVRRVTEAQHVDRTVLVISDSPQHRRLARLIPADVDVFRARGEDTLACVNSAANEYGAESLVLVDIENPFVDPSLVDRLVVDARAHPNCDYASFFMRSQSNLLATRLGLVAEWCTAAALRIADLEASSVGERSRITPYLYSHPEEFTIRLIPVPAELDRSDIRLSIHGEEDWDHANLILDALGPDDVDWQHIAGLLDQQTSNS